MTILFRRLLLTVLVALAFAAPSHADEAELRAIIAKFAAAKGFPATEAIISELAATGDTSVERPLAALAEGNLYFRKSDSAVFIGKEAGQAVTLADPLTGADAGEDLKASVTKVRVNNTLRRVSSADLLGTLTLGSDDPAVRLAAAETMFRTPTRRRYRASTPRSPRKRSPASGQGSNRRALPPSSSPTCPRPKNWRRSTSSPRAATATRCRC